MGQSFAIEQGGLTKLDLGPPIKVAIATTTGRVGNGVSVSLKFGLEGSNGEKYAYLRKNGKKIKLPKISIRNARGKEVKKGQFSYG